MSDNLGDRAEALTEEVAGLRQAVDRNGQRVDGLREDIGRLGDRQSRSEGRIIWVAVAAVVALVLALAIGITAYRGVVTDHRVDGFCPVLALVIGGYDPSTRPAGDARDKYVASFDVMRKAYTDLACTQPLVPPRTAK